MQDAAGLHPAADELEAMLDLTAELAALPEVAVSPAARDETRREFLAVAEGHRAAWVHQHRLEVRRARHPLPSHGFRWSFVVTVAVILALLAGVTLALASQLAEPDGTLYPLKLDTERVLLAINRSQLSQASVHVQLASERFRDTEAMAAKGKGDLAVSSMSAYYDQLRQAGGLLVVTQSSPGWKSVRDQFDGAEGRPIDPILVQLQANHQDAAVKKIDSRWLKKRAR